MITIGNGRARPRQPRLARYLLQFFVFRLLRSRTHGFRDLRSSTKTGSARDEASHAPHRDMEILTYIIDVS